MKKTPFRRACESCETTPTTLGHILHIEGSLMRRYALGAMKPLPKRAAKIAKVLGLTVSELGWE